MQPARKSPGRALADRRRSEARAEAVLLDAQRAWEVGGAGALRKFQEAGRLAKLGGHPRIEARSLAFQAGIHLDRMELELAGQCAKHALARYTALEDKAAIIQTRMALGTIALFRGDFETARRHFTAGLAVAEGEANPLLRIMPLRNLGLVKRARGDLAGAEATYREALAIARAAGGDRQVAVLTLNLGIVMRDAGRAAEAERALNEAIDHYDRRGEAISREYARINLADLRIDRGDWRAALEICKRVAATARQCDDRRLAAFVELVRGRALAGAGRAREGIERVRAATASAARAGILFEVPEQLGLLAGLLEARGKSAEAAEFRRIGINIARKLGRPDLAAKLAPAKSAR